MTALQSAVYAALAGYNGVNGLVGTRVYPGSAPQGVARPYIVWDEISQVNATSLSGSKSGSTGLLNARVQVTCWCAGEDGGTKVRELDAQVQLAMESASAFRCTLIEGRSLGREPDTKLFGFQSDFSVWLKL